MANQAQTSKDRFERPPRIMRSRPSRSFVGTAIVALLGVAALASSAAAKPPLGAPLQLSGTNGCMNSVGGSCAQGEGLGGVFNLTVSPDGANLYSVSQGLPDASNAVAEFTRNTTTGVLTQLADPNDCISETGNGGTCGTGRALGTPMQAVVSSDHKNVYVVSYNSDGVAVFTRDAVTGALTQTSDPAGCVSEQGKDDAVGSFPYPVVCNVGSNLFQSQRIAISPDDKNVYVTARGDSNGSVIAFTRNTTTGELTQISGSDGCLSTSTQGGACRAAAGLSNPQGIAMGGDGNVYVAGTDDRAVVVLNRNSTTGVLSPNPTTPCFSSYGDPCTLVSGLTSVKDVKVSPAGGSVWASASGAVVKFLRNTSGGALTPDSCFASLVGGEPTCATSVRGMRHADALAFAPNGENLYIASGNFSSLAYLFQPTTNNGWGCVNTFAGDDCRPGRAMTDPRGIAVSPDSKFIYLASVGTNTAGSSSIDTFKRELTDNHLPTCADQTVEVPYNTAVTIALTCSDEDGDSPLSLGFTQGSHGTVASGSAPNTIVYTPNGGFSGADSIDVGVWDDVYGTASTVTVVVGQSPPVAPSAPAPTAGGSANTGDRAAALKKCKKKTGAARKKCKKKANKLPE